MKLSALATALLLAVATQAESASYQVTEIPLSDTALSHFAVSIDDTGKTLSTLRNRFNPVVDLTLFDADQFVLTDPEAAEAGNFNTTDLSIVANSLIANSSNGDLFNQKLASLVAYESDGTDIDYVFGFDSETPETQGFTFSLTTTVADSVNGTHIVGGMAGPYMQIPYTDANNNDLLYVVNEYESRAFAQVGAQTTELVPSYSQAGGVSFASSINDALQVAGVTSVAASSGLQTLIDNCVDDTLRGDEPEEACLYRTYISSNLNANFITSPSFLYRSTIERFESAPQSVLDIRATRWQLDASGNVISSETFPLLFEPDEFNIRMFTRALDINNQGTMVGFSTIPELANDELVAVATVFENGQTTRLLNENDFVASYAMAINDDDIVVGFYPIVSNDRVRNRMFVFDRNTDTLTRPLGFFVSSSTHPRAINNNGLVVGDGESDIVDQANSIRLSSGFLYNINDDTFDNLNDLLPCDSPYNIISANDVNDAGVIVADAQVTRPITDISGAPVTGDNAGDNEVVVSVKLTPTGNPPEDCGTIEEEFAERQGASTSLVWLFPLLLVALIRRRIGI